VDIALLKKLMKRTLNHSGSPLRHNTSQADECSSSPAANPCARACGLQIRPLPIRALADKTGIYYGGLQTAPPNLREQRGCESIAHSRLGRIRRGSGARFRSSRLRFLRRTASPSSAYSR
jgi:hypothetical protein